MSTEQGAAGGRESPAHDWDKEWDTDQEDGTEAGQEQAVERHLIQESSQSLVPVPKRNPLMQQQSSSFQPEVKQDAIAKQASQGAGAPNDIPEEVSDSVPTPVANPLRPSLPRDVCDPNAAASDPLLSSAEAQGTAAMSSAGLSATPLDQKVLTPYRIALLALSLLLLVFVAELLELRKMSKVEDGLAKTRNRIEVLLETKGGQSNKTEVNKLRSPTRDNGADPSTPQAPRASCPPKPLVPSRIGCPALSTCTDLEGLLLDKSCYKVVPGNDYYCGDDIMCAAYSNCIFCLSDCGTDHGRARPLTNWRPAYYANPYGSGYQRFPSGTTAAVGYVLRPNQRDSILAMHNDVRAYHGACPLEWDPNIVANIYNNPSAEWAGCRLVHSASSQRWMAPYGFLGEILSASFGSGPDYYSNDCPEALRTRAWYRWITDWDFATNSGTPGTRHWLFTQVVSKNTTHLGCYIHQCEADVHNNVLAMLLICQYGPGGNIEAQHKDQVLRGGTAPSCPGCAEGHSGGGKATASLPAIKPGTKKEPPRRGGTPPRREARNDSTSAPDRPADEHDPHLDTHENLRAHAVLTPPPSTSDPTGGLSPSPTSAPSKPPTNRPTYGTSSPDFPCHDPDVCLSNLRGARPADDACCADKQPSSPRKKRRRGS
eukprot:TRINITY_DN5225_c0_g1_i3.p1 TRINITY_DN5225_c0_g1~~TRINITY_DN5225_c0_g1_i3.p1  ORF type:complete len:689 (+),score=78.26 TRINITY_DN5225_c0_g1_i3:103-2067(+)